jgi:hypothetical protein
MTDTIPFYINKYFKFLLEQFDFEKSNEKCDEQYYEVKFHAHDMSIRLEKYRREVYVYLSKPSKADEELNLFSLIEYLDRNIEESVKSNYFLGVKDLNECYRLQIEWLATVLKMYLPKARTFFLDKFYSKNFTAFSDFVIKKHPDLYAKRSNRDIPK